MYTFEINGKTYEVKSNPLDCPCGGTIHPEDYEEPVTAYAESNLEDTWYALER